MVALASVALVVAVNFGLASAHPFAEPTPPPIPTPRVDTNVPAAPSATETDVEQEGDQQKVDTNDDMDDVDEMDTDDNESGDAGEDVNDDDKRSTAPTMTSPTTSKEKHGHDNEQDGEHAGDD